VISPTICAWVAGRNDEYLTRFANRGQIHRLDRFISDLDMPNDSFVQRTFLIPALIHRGHDTGDWISAPIRSREMTSTKMLAESMNQKPQHATITLERSYRAPLERVFSEFAEWEELDFPTHAICDVLCDLRSSLSLYPYIGL
jgi:hypothetical protein